jgi:glyoxylase-like metal-dependent hydrolase (beta-lactamase superfamily II)
MPDTTPRVLALGAATITILNAGDMMFDLAESLNVSANEWRPRYGTTFEGPRRYPSQSVHIALPGASILVDANDYAHTVPGSDFAVPDYEPPPPLTDQLLIRGIAPEDITHLIITHAHFDHYSGTTVKRGTVYLPRFPNARVFLGRPDWDWPNTQLSLTDPASDDSHTFGVLQALGLLELVEGSRDLTPEVRVIAAPGESPGHQIVRVQSQGHTLYCLGDLFHHPVEAENPAWMVQWANPNTNQMSRRALIQSALQENALLLAAHVPLGKLEGTPSDYRWVTS